MIIKANIYIKYLFIKKNANKIIILTLNQKNKITLPFRLSV